MNKYLDELSKVFQVIFFLIVRELFGGLPGKMFKGNLNFHSNHWKKIVKKKEKELLKQVPLENLKESLADFTKEAFEEFPNKFLNVFFLKTSLKEFEIENFGKKIREKSNFLKEYLEDILNKSVEEMP